jgi:hypothetical protein
LHVGFAKSAPTGATISSNEYDGFDRLLEKESYMRYFGRTLVAFLVICSASAALAQYGLYGAPNVLPVQQQSVSPAYAAPASYPAQPAATTTYQPYQPAAQYRYPTPNCRPTAWAAPAEQPMAAPTNIPAGPVYQPSQPSQGYAQPQGSSMTNQMLAEQNASSCYAGGCNDGNNGCAPDVLCGQDCECLWYASISALVLGRTDGRRVWTSYEDQHLTNQLTNTQFPTSWKWGGEIRFGRRFCAECVPYAIEGTYWTTDSFSGNRSTAINGGYVSTPLDLNYMTFGGQQIKDWFNGAQEHRLSRSDEVHNVEINVIREQLSWCNDSGWDIGWSMGVRYFRFVDYLQFGSLSRGGTDWNDLPDTAYLSDRATNNLIGAQFGFDAAYRVWNNFRVFITPKVGIYDNFMDNTFTANTGNGIDAVGPYGTYPVSSSRNGVAFLTQIDLGADWHFARNWSARAGYRVVAMTGMALADDQFPQYICDSPDIENIQHTSSLVLHGAFFGATYNF